MSFIVDNYVWFIIAGFVLLMITIGYYAEKTNFGKKTSDEDNASNDTDVPAFSGNKKRLLDVTASSQIVEGQPTVQPMPVPDVDSQNFDTVVPPTEMIDILDDSNIKVDNIEMPIQIPEVEPIANSSVNNMKPGTFDDDVWKF